MLTFRILAQDGAARTGVLQTARGAVETPAFMPVGTLGAAKGLTPQQLQEHGVQMLLMNALHLAWRPGEEAVRELGGLHRFSGWPGPILTDSGGFQIFSLPGLRKVREEGAVFASPVDGREREFTPEAVVDLQFALGADIIMALDHCPPAGCGRSELEAAVERSICWAERSARRHGEWVSGRRAGCPVDPREVNLFGIVQGGTDERLRRRSAEATCALPCAGFALGGFSVGEAREATREGIACSAPLLPADKPRYLMGMGEPADLLHAMARGLDLADCTLPTRNGRNATVFTSEGRLRLRNARYARDDRPLDLRCRCYACRNFSRAFLRHLFLAREMNAAILASLHNAAFYQALMADSRAAIREGKFAEFRSRFEARYAPADDAAAEDADSGP